MDWIFKKMGPAAALSLVAFTSIVNAADDSQMRNLENRVNALEQKKGGNGGMINPPARPVVKDGVDLFVTGEVLIWKATADDLDYAVQLDQVPTFSNAKSGEGVHFKGKWNVGFRVGIGYNMPHDGWDLNLAWTRFNSHSKDSDDNDCNCVSNIFQPIYYPKDYNVDTDAGAPYVTEADGKYWRANLNIVDLELGREFFVSKWMTLRPFLGVRGAWLRQKTRFEYEGGNFFNTDLTTFLPGANADYVFMKNNHWGVGLRAGMNTTWGLGAGVSLYGNCALSALWGKMKLTQTQTLENDVTEATGVLTNFSDRFTVVRPVLDLAAGLRYDTLFADDSWGFGIWAGWEQHYFWDQMRFLKFSGEKFAQMGQNEGDFSVGGVNVGMSFDF